MQTIIGLLIAIILTILMFFITNGPLKDELREWRNVFLKPAVVTFCIILVVGGIIAVSIMSEHKQIQKEHDEYIEEQEEVQIEQDEASKKLDQYLSELEENPNKEKHVKDLDFDGNGVISEYECMSVPGFRYYQLDRKCYASGY